MRCGCWASKPHFSIRLSQQTRSAIEQQLIEGVLDLLYIAPERLTQARTLHLLKEAKLALFAIDEAHCVSLGA